MRTAATVRGPSGALPTATPPLGTVGGAGERVHQPTARTGTSAPAGARPAVIGTTATAIATTMRRAHTQLMITPTVPQSVLG